MGEIMPTSRNLPSPMCPGCKFYEFRKGSSSPHMCKDAGSFTNRSKIGHDPNIKGTGGTCKTFEPR